MAKVVIRDIDQRVDGEYELVSVDEWSFDDWYQVKKNTGLVLSDFINADESGLADTAVILALATVSLERAGVSKAHSILRYGKIDNIELVPDEDDVAEEEEGPPEAPSTDFENASSSSTNPDGESAKTPSALSAVILDSTGDPISPTGFPRSAMSA